MPKKPKRDNDYYLERIRQEHPQVHADYLAGKFRNATEARKAAGQIKVRTALEKLDLAWKEANPTERDTFKHMIGCTASPGASTAPSSPAGGSVAGTTTSLPVTLITTPATGSAMGQSHTRTTAAVTAQNNHRPERGQLTAMERLAVREIMDRRRMKLGDVMRELGLDPRDASIGNALRRGEHGTLTNDLLARLRPWIAQHRKP